MFVPLWMVFLISGTLMAVLAVLWAISSHQFDDQERARFLPLHDLTAADYAEVAAPRTRGLGYYVTLILVSIGVMSLILTLVTVLKTL